MTETSVAWQPFGWYCPGKDRFIGRALHHCSLQPDKVFDTFTLLNVHIDVKDAEHAVGDILNLGRSDACHPTHPCRDGGLLQITRPCEVNLVDTCR